MTEKKITEKITDAARTLIETAKAVATSDETKAAFVSAKETIGKAVKSHKEKGDSAPKGDDTPPEKEANADAVKDDAEEKPKD